MAVQLRLQVGHSLSRCREAFLQTLCHLRHQIRSFASHWKMWPLGIVTGRVVTRCRSHL
jgi:hypothetical protein